MYRNFFILLCLFYIYISPRFFAAREILVRVPEISKHARQDDYSSCVFSKTIQEWSLENLAGIACQVA